MPAKAPQDPMLSSGLEYLSRCSTPYKASALLFNARSRNDDNAQRRKAVEGEALLEKTEGFFRIALSEHAKTLDTPKFAAYLEKLSNQHAQVAFIIGGAFGLGPEVIAKSNVTLSLSPLTMPHRLAFLVLAEQLYRASEIRRGSPYHK